MKDCDISSGQNILWPLLHISKGSISLQPPRSKPLASSYCYSQLLCICFSFFRNRTTENLLRSWSFFLPRNATEHWPRRLDSCIRASWKRL